MQCYLLFLVSLCALAMSDALHANAICIQSVTAEEVFENVNSPLNMYVPD